MQREIFGPKQGEVKEAGVCTKLHNESFKICRHDCYTVINKREVSQAGPLRMFGGEER